MTFLYFSGRSIPTTYKLFVEIHFVNSSKVKRKVAF